MAGVLAAIGSSCTLHQSPGSYGDDPTEVILSADVNINLQLPRRVEAVPTTGRGPVELKHRFVVEAMGDDYRVHDRRVMYMPVDDDVEHVMLPVDMRLHARNYRLLVWSDYISIEEGDTTTFYDPASLTPVLPQKGYRVNTELKDAFSVCHKLDLRSYKDEWQAKVSASIDLKRPVARYELITTDLGAFQRKLAAGDVKGKSFSARIRYATYVATGFNVAEQTPKNLLNFLNYSTRLSTINNADLKELTIGFDYVVTTPETERIPVDIEIVNENNEVVSRTAVNIEVQAGYNTTIRGRFLTASTDGGVSIDPDYDGTIFVDLGKL